MTVEELKKRISKEKYDNIPANLAALQAIQVILQPSDSHIGKLGVIKEYLKLMDDTMK